MNNYKRKTYDIYRIYTNYGYGWEEESTADTMKDAKYQMKEYLLAGAKAVKISRGRLPL